MAAHHKPTELHGIVTKFKGNGRKLGYPTANFQSDTTLPDGVYFGFATMDSYRRHPALIFIGVPTTVGDKTRRVEAHLLDITDRDYYGLALHIEVVKYHRSNQTFGSVEELLLAMKVDEKKAREWFKDQ